MSLVPVTNLIGMGFTVPHGTVPLVIVALVIMFLGTVKTKGCC